MSRRPILLIGWQAADWKLLHPLLDAGAMPNLQALIARGVMGTLAATSTATSGTPLVLPRHRPSCLAGHGILGESQNPET